MVKLKDEYISNLESSATVDESEERPYMNPSLKAALWCAPAYCSSACPGTKVLSVLISSVSTGFTSRMLPPAAFHGHKTTAQPLSQLFPCLGGSNFVHPPLQRVLCHSAQQAEQI